jgi:hypothetical protein
MSAVTISTEVHAPSPHGAPFIVERRSFPRGVRFASYESAGYDIAQDRVVDWPMIYILANDHEAYVGQTTSVSRRMEQHAANPEKAGFTDCNIIYNEELNRSVLDDYEHRLIELMNADGRYTVTNRNDGLTDYRYFGKSQYAAMFESLWGELRRLELADHSIAELEASEVFKYSPFKALNADQRVALDRVLEAVDKPDAGPVVVEGMPGTGKTVLAVYLLKALRDNEQFAGLEVGILEPVTSLRETLKKSLKGVSGLSPKDIVGPYDLRTRTFDVLLVDETHRLKQQKNLGQQGGLYKRVNREIGLPENGPTMLDWVLKRAKTPVLFYDPLQVVGPAGIGPTQMRASLGPAFDAPIELRSQMRVKGGEGYLNHVSAMLRGGDPASFDARSYEFVLHDDFADFVAAFTACLEENSLTRMVAGYAWKWVTKDVSREADPDLYDITIDGIGLRWNCCQENWVGRGFDDPDIAREVGCIHSIQGYDLSYAFVIVGPDLVLGPDGLPKADKSSYFDRNGKATATDADLDAYIRNIYYVLLTRGVLGTHVYVCDPAVRERFARYISQQ